MHRRVFQDAGLLMSCFLIDFQRNGTCLCMNLSFLSSGTSYLLFGKGYLRSILVVVY